jgi:hypothetical protein
VNSFASVLRALLTLAAAAFPTATMLGVFAQHPDDTLKVIELFGNAASALWLYLRKPHPWLFDAWYWVKSVFRKKVAP